MGRRYWTWWNIMDCTVVWLSVGLLVIKLLLEDMEYHSSANTIIILRVVYRVALVLRMVRVLLKLRRANQLRFDLIRGHV
ncbi:hypothetical protein T484DRAFT_1866864 [Baffinella frigidus]|nr:hypothetical protein T484DRAFT_1866864 [Cryptophyta sp. CCMP2293]